jgi:hypothetical protein
MPTIRPIRATPTGGPGRISLTSATLACVLERFMTAA